MTRCPFVQHQNGTWKRGMNGTNGSAHSNGDLSDGFLTPHNTSVSLEMLSGSCDNSLANSPTDPGREAREAIVRPKTLVERARMNVG